MVRMRFHPPVGGHLNTQYISIDSQLCQACWKCVDGCPRQVLGKVIFLNHRHARVDHPQACKGCKKCVRNCPNSAIRDLNPRLAVELPHAEDHRGASVIIK